MVSAEFQITNLLYRYGEFVDQGNYEAAAELFAHAQIKTPMGMIDATQLLDQWKNGILLHDGSPRTKHVITNPIIEIDEETGTATCRSTCTVFQQVGDFPLQPILCGRYDDRFERVDGKWRFHYRDYTLEDLSGDKSRHAPAWP